MNLRGTTGLVTGGAVRIGRAICEALAAEGCRVAVHYRGSAAEARSLVARLRGLGAEAWAVPGDLARESACERVVREAARRAGVRLDFLVNNAAVFHKHSLAGATRETVLREFGANLLAPLSLTRAFAAQCRTEGRIVNLLDRRVAGVEAGCVPYLLSKKCLADLTRIAALELAPRIAVNGVAPGAVLPPPGKGADYLRDNAGRVPLERQVTPAEIAAAVVFLLKSDAITGQVLYVDGGQHLLGSVE